MTLEVPLSVIGGQDGAFKAAVDGHIAALKAFTKTTGKPRPTAHPLVEQAIKRIQRNKQPDDFEADYTIIDDTPPPPVLTLEQKKEKLRSACIAAENEAKFKLLPKEKVRLAILKFQMASAKPEEERTAEEREDINSYNLVQKAWSLIELASATAESDIGDLTADTVDSWQVPTFG